MAALPPASFFPENDPFSLMVWSEVAAAASGGDFARTNIMYFSLEVWSEVAALPPAAIFPEK